MLGNVNHLLTIDPLTWRYNLLYLVHQIKRSKNMENDYYEVHENEYITDAEREEINKEIAREGDF